MDKKQLTGIFAGIGYFLLYACLMMVFQMLYTFVIMGISYIGGTRKETDFMSFANNNLLTAALLTIVSVGVIFYLIFKRRGKGVKINISFCQLLFSNSPRSRSLPYITESPCGCSCGRRDSNAWRRIYSHRECRGEQISHHYQFAALRFDACRGGWTHIGNRCCTDGAGFCTHLCKDQ